MKEERSKKDIMGALYMFLVSTFLLVLLIVYWKGSSTDYFGVFGCLFGYGFSAHLLRRYYKKEERQLSGAEIEKTKRRLIRVSLITLVISIVVLEIVMYAQEYSSVALILFPILSAIVIGTVLFFSLRSYFREVDGKKEP